MTAPDPLHDEHCQKCDRARRGARSITWGAGNRLGWYCVCGWLNTEDQLGIGGEYLSRNVRADICPLCGSGLLDGEHIADYPPCHGK